GEIDNEFDHCGAESSSTESLTIDELFLSLPRRFTHTDITNEILQNEAVFVSGDALLLEILAHDYINFQLGGQTLVVCYAIERFLKSLGEASGNPPRLIWFSDLASAFSLDPRLNFLYTNARAHSERNCHKISLVFENPFSAAFREAIRACCYPCFF